MLVRPFVDTEIGFRYSSWRVGIAPEDHSADPGRLLNSNGSTLAYVVAGSTQGLVGA